MDWFLYDRNLRHERVKPFRVTCLFLCPLKTLENQRLSDVFRGVWKETVTWNRLKAIGRHNVPVNIIRKCIFEIFNKHYLYASIMRKTKINFSELNKCLQKATPFWKIPGNNIRNWIRSCSWRLGTLRKVGSTTVIFSKISKNVHKSYSVIHL